MKSFVTSQRVSKKRRLPVEDKHQVLLQQICHQLHQSFTDDQRESSFLRTLSIVDHRSEDLHNVEVKECLDSSLCLQLGYILNKNPKDGTHVVRIINILSLVYQCSDDLREESFRRIGNDLFVMMDKSLESYLDTDFDEMLSYYVAKVLRSLSRLAYVSKIMVENLKLLTFIQRTISKEKIQLGSKLEAVATLKNLSFHNEEHRLMILRHPYLIDSLIIMCTETRDCTLHEFSSAVMRNLAMSLETKCRMVEHTPLLNMLIQLANDENINTRRNSIGTIASLSIDESNSIIFVSHGEGVFCNLLQRSIQHDPDPIIRRRAVRALRCLACKYTLHALLNSEDLMKTLCKTISKNERSDIKLEACETLIRFMSDTDKCSPFYSIIIDSILSFLKEKPPTRCIESVARVINMIILNNRKGIDNLILQGDILIVITLILSSPQGNTVSQDHVLSAISSLSDKECYRVDLTRQPILSVLTSVASPNNKNRSSARLLSIRTILNLAKNLSNRKIMATEPGLLNALVKSAESSEDTMMKEAIKTTIINLMPFL